MIKPPQTAHEAYQLVMSIPMGSPPYQLACEVCVMRGTNPFEQAPTGGPPMYRWQAVIAEQALTVALLAAL